MDDSNSTKREGDQPSRTPYQPPAIEQSATFERLQLSCTFHAEENPTCDLGTPSS